MAKTTKKYLKEYYKKNKERLKRYRDLKHPVKSVKLTVGRVFYFGEVPFRITKVKKGFLTRTVIFKKDLTKKIK